MFKQVNQLAKAVPANEQDDEDDARWRWKAHDADDAKHALMK